MKVLLSFALTIHLTHLSTFPTAPYAKITDRTSRWHTHPAHLQRNGA